MFRGRKKINQKMSYPKIIASWFKSNNTIVLQWAWWWKVDIVEVLFFLAILSANVHFILNASGIVQKYKKRHALSSVIGVWYVLQTPLNDGDKCPSFLIEKRPCCNVAKKNKVIEIRNEKLVCNGTHYVSQYQMEEVKSPATN